jgi:hypothetical protein
MGIRMRPVRQRQSSPRSGPTRGSSSESISPPKPRSRRPVAVDGAEFQRGRRARAGPEQDEAPVRGHRRQGGRGECPAQPVDDHRGAELDQRVG